MNFFDLHCDTATECYIRSLPFSASELAVNESAARCFEKWYQCFAFFIKEDILHPYKYYNSILADFNLKLSSLPKNLTPIFTVEGGSLIENDTDRIYKLKADGIRALSLTWNGENNIASGAMCEGGLKDFGKQVINVLNKCDIAIDFSHLNRQSFYDCIELAKHPIATHSCCDFLCNHKRNLTDSQIKALVQKNGIIGICFYPQFLGEGDIFENIYKNIYYLLEMGYENNIAIGSDFDGGELDSKLNKTSKVLDLYEKLIAFGIDDVVLNKIFYENAYNFFNNL